MAEAWHVLVHAGGSGTRVSSILKEQGILSKPFIQYNGVSLLDYTLSQLPGEPNITAFTDRPQLLEDYSRKLTVEEQLLDEVPLQHCLRAKLADNESSVLIICGHHPVPRSHYLDMIECMLDSDAALVATSYAAVTNENPLQILSTRSTQFAGSPYLWRVDVIPLLESYLNKGFSPRSAQFIEYCSTKTLVKFVDAHFPPEANTPEDLLNTFDYLRRGNE